MLQIEVAGANGRGQVVPHRVRGLRLDPVATRDAEAIRPLERFGERDPRRVEHPLVQVIPADDVPRRCEAGVQREGLAQDAVAADSVSFVLERDTFHVSTIRLERGCGRLLQGEVGLDRGAPLAQAFPDFARQPLHGGHDVRIGRRARHRDDVGARLGIDDLKHDRIARPAQSADAPDQNRANGAAVGQLPSDLGRDVHRVGFARRAEHAAELLARERAEVAGLVELRRRELAQGVRHPGIVRWAVEVRHQDPVSLAKMRRACAMQRHACQHRDAGGRDDARPPEAAWQAPRTAGPGCRMGPGEGRLERSGRREAVGGQLRERDLDRADDVARQRRAHDAERARRLLEVSRQHAAGPRAREGGRARQHLVHDACQRVLIAAAVHFGARRLLGAHVGGRAERHARGGERVATGLAHGVRDAEVGDHGVAPGQQNVLGLDVAVDDAPAVRVVERLGHFGGDLQRLGRGEPRLAGQALAQRIAFDERHDVVQEPGGRARVVQRQDVGVSQVGGDVDFADKALGSHGRGNVGTQHLERDLAAVLHILGEKDRRHRPVAQLPLDGVPPG